MEPSATWYESESDDDDDGGGGEDEYYHDVDPIPWVTGARVRKVGSSSDAKKLVKNSNHLKKLFLVKLKDEIGIQKGSLSIQSSSCVEGFGGTSTNKTSFAHVLQRYFRDIFPSLMCSRSEPYEILPSSVGAISRHRDLIDRYDHGNNILNIDEEHFSLASILSLEEAEMAEALLLTSCRHAMSNPKSLNEFMARMENLGHSAAPFIEGLNVELLPFQKQTVQWATERETAAGGVNSFSWTKIPFISAQNTELYYNPALRTFQTSKPSLVRGGIIAGKQLCD